MDSDDELIVRMKQAKYQEKEIAQRLIDEGRTNYHPKTIGTRWARLKKAMQVRNDELLDQDLTDWHDGDVSLTVTNSVSVYLRCLGRCSRRSHAEGRRRGS